MMGQLMGREIKSAAVAPPCVVQWNKSWGSGHKSLNTMREKIRYLTVQQENSDSDFSSN